MTGKLKTLDKWISHELNDNQKINVSNRRRTSRSSTAIVRATTIVSYVLTYNSQRSNRTAMKLHKTSKSKFRKKKVMFTA